MMVLTSMARQQKLKVFRTPIGFHDAYVATPSQKAALAAWGSDANLFARGMAEIVTDDALTKEPLAAPGKVIKRLRGSAQDHVAALRADGPAKGRRSPKPSKIEGSETAKAPTARKREPKPRPSRAALDAAEGALETLVAQHAREDENLQARQRALDQERRALDRTHAEETKTVETKVDRARKAHDEALGRWFEEQD